MAVVVHILNNDGSVKAVLSHASFDIAVGESENDFELSFTDILPESVMVNPGDMWCVNESEYGGIIDSIRDNDGETVYSGRSWSGVFGNKIVEPEKGDDYYVLSENLTTCIQVLLKHVNAPSFISVLPSSNSNSIGILQLPRYCTAYEALQRLCDKANRCLGFYYDVDAKKLYIITVDKQIISNLYATVHVDATVNNNVVNHIIGLGKGDLKDRLVVHVYADSRGVVSDKQSLFGINELTAVHELSSEEDVEKLKSECVKKLQEYQELTVAKISLGDSSRELGVGDRVVAESLSAHVTVEAAVSKKITQLDNGVLSYSYTLSDKRRVTSNY